MARRLPGLSIDLARQQPGCVDWQIMRRTLWRADLDDARNANSLPLKKARPGQRTPPGRYICHRTPGTATVGIARTWPLAGVFGRCLASLRVVGHSRRSRWSVRCGPPVGPGFPVPQRYDDCRCVSRSAAAAERQASACCGVSRRCARSVPASQDAPVQGLARTAAHSR